MTILQLIYALEVADCKNISKAAENLYVSQPALSLQLKALEKELDYKLFNRMAQGVSLTEQGEVFQKNARPVADAWREFQLNLNMEKDRDANKLRIGMGSRTFFNGIFEQVISYFDKVPEAEVTFITGIAEDPFDAILENRMDIALDRLPSSFMKKNLERFTIIPIISERQCILISKKDSRSSLSEMVFTDLDGAAVVSGPENSLDDSILKENCRHYGIKFSKTYRADKIEAVMSLVSSGKGVAIGPESFARQYNVIAVPMVPEVYIPVNLVYLKRANVNPMFMALEERLKDFAEGMEN